MQRTAGDRRRRQRLADASITPIGRGGVMRANVVLYAPLAPGDDEAAMRAELRDYAEARDWNPASEIIDRDPLCTPIGERTAWPAIRQLLTSRRAEGIVMTRGLCTLPDHVEGEEQVREWLADNAAFLVAVRSCPHTRDGEPS